MANEETQIEVVDAKTMKRIEEIADKMITLRLQKDYRATLVHREEKGGIDDSEAALIHINESTRDELNNPIELDIKGTIDGYDAWLFKEMRYGRALMKLKEWRYFEEITQNKDGSITITRTPVDLAQILMLAKSRLNMAVNGNQSWKHIHERRANSGNMADDGFLSKAASWSGLKREKVSREHMNESYGNKDNK